MLRESRAHSLDVDSHTTPSLDCFQNSSIEKKKAMISFLPRCPIACLLTIKYTEQWNLVSYLSPIVAKQISAKFTYSISLLAVCLSDFQKILSCRYEDAFNRFIDEINSVAAYDWWEGSVHSILSVLAYPCAWSWNQWRRRNKIHRLQEFVKSEYDHSCLRSCRSRALYKGMKVWKHSITFHCNVPISKSTCRFPPNIPGRYLHWCRLSLLGNGTGWW